MQWSALAQHLSEHLQQQIRIDNAQAVSGGDINQAYQLQSNQGPLFLKLNQAELAPLFATEAHSLHAIAKTHSIRCPNVLGHGVFANQAWLLMEYLELSANGNDRQRGQAVARMHQHTNQDPKPFGWFEDNFIGHSKQPNSWHSDWATFYGQQRLKPQLELAIMRGASQTLYQQGMQLIDNLEPFFTRYQPQASLLHGDLWAGNSAFINSEPNNEAVLFDPASYYGDRETDLAMTEMFGGYSREFYAGYHAVYPIDAGYQERKPLYTLYHVLNHYNLFGGHYGSQAQSLIKQLLARVAP